MNRTQSLTHRLLPPSFALALALAGLAPGCTPGGRDSPLSPTVEADSEAGVKAREQDRTLVEERRRQEASVRQRHPRLPAGE